MAGSNATSGYAAIVLDRLARQACQVVESAGSTIFARDRRAPGTAIAVAACGRHAEKVGSRFPAFDGFSRTVLNAGTRATVPACWRGQVNGALAADSVEGRRFDRRDLTVLGELATTAGAALDHAERRQHVLREVRARVRALVRKLDAHDGYTAGHSSEVVAWACAVGERLRLSLPDLLELELGALLHDLGKVRVPDRVHQARAARPVRA
jgi:GAF domain-containing protein